MVTLALAALGLFAAGCEDTPPNSYLEEYVVQGVLVVDKPLQGIIIQRALPTTDTFSMKNAIVKNADVRITDEAGREFVLQFREGGSFFGDYAFADTAVIVQPNTEYSLKIRTPDGKIMTGKTRTPNRFSWISPPKATLQFPLDTLEMPSPDSLKLRWTAGAGVHQYLIRLTCLDTLGYGKYLTPETAELNRRRKRPFERENDPNYYSITEYGFLQTNEVNTVWNAFKWYGKFSIVIMAADANTINWFKLYFQSGNQYIPHQGSITGGAGMFGSAAEVEQETFILKNQP